MGEQSAVDSGFEQGRQRPSRTGDSSVHETSMDDRQLNLLAAISDTPSKKSGRQDGSDLGPLPEVARLLKKLPEGQNTDIAVLSDAAKSAGSYSVVEPFMHGIKSVMRQGAHVDIHRDDAQQYALNRNIIDGKASVDHLNLGKTISFDLADDERTFRNVQGLSISASAFGMDKDLAIREVQAATGENGKPAVSAKIENPIPAAAREILSMSDLLPITLESEKGKLQSPKASSILGAVANSSGDSVPGFLFKDAIQNSADIARFSEQNPKWINDVIKPMLDEVKKQATKESAPPSVPSPEQKPDKAADNLNSSAQSQRLAKSADNTDYKPDSEDKPKPATIAPGDHIRKGGDYDQTVSIDGKDRHYSLHVPPDYDPKKPIPIVLMLHGRGQDGKEFAERTHMNEKADKEGFAVAYPDATKWLGRKDLSAWDASNGLVPPGGHADDLKFLRTVIDRTQSQLKVDPERIYMIGHSSGGMMTYLAASELSDKLAAVASISSSMSGKEPKPKFPVSVMSTHGTDDEVIPINGLKDVPPILAGVGIPTFNTPEFATNFWKRQDGINSHGIVTKDGDVTKRHFDNPTNGTAVDELTLKGSEHTPEDRFHIYDEAWKFLAKHPKASGSVASSNDPAELNDSRPNPLQHIVDEIKNRGSDAIADDVGKIYRHSSLLPDGTISPSDILAKVESKVSMDLKNPVTDFIGNTTSLSKNGNHVELKSKNPTEFAINSKIGPGSIKSLGLNNVQFDLDGASGRPRLSNIKGIIVGLDALGFDLSSKLTDITDTVDKSGHHTYKFRFDNPTPSPLRRLLWAPDSVDVGVQVDIDGKVKVANDKEIKHDLLGSNPITRGLIDIGGDVSTSLTQPSLKNHLNLTTDSVATAVPTMLGFLSPRWRPITTLSGFLGGTALVHYLHEKTR